MLVGVFIAAQLIWPELNLAPWLVGARWQQAEQLRRGARDVADVVEFPGRSRYGCAPQ